MPSPGKLKMGLRINCWDFKKCGRNRMGDCPAYPKGGRVCYLVSRTMCAGTADDQYALKVQHCRECEFYKGLVIEKTL